MGDRTVTELGGQQAVSSGRPPMRELPQDSLPGQTGWDMVPAC